MTDATRNRHLEAVPLDIVERYRLDRLPFDRPGTAVADLLRLDGHVAVVTGGGGDGLGNAICHRLAEQGAVVAVLDKVLTAADKTAGQLRDRYGATALSIVADITSLAGCRDAVHAVTEAVGAVDLLVNNAGGGFDTVGVDFADLSDDQLAALVSLNFSGPLHMSKAVLDAMVKRGSGTIINITSESGLFSTSGIVTYSSCKAGIIRFSESLAHEVGPRGVRVVSVSPGTLIAERNLERMRGASATHLGPLDQAMARTSLDRASLPDEVATVVSFLASAAGGYVHGTNVSVGGGMSG
jgi:3-oxoacyl-[acyl-carrier protein] reductase